MIVNVWAKWHLTPEGWGSNAISARAGSPTKSKWHLTPEGWGSNAISAPKQI